MLAGNSFFAYPFLVASNSFHPLAIISEQLKVAKLVPSLAFLSPVWKVLELDSQTVMTVTADSNRVLITVPIERSEREVSHGIWNQRLFKREEGRIRISHNSKVEGNKGKITKD